MTKQQTDKRAYPRNSGVLFLPLAVVEQTPVFLCLTQAGSNNAAI